MNETEFSSAQQRLFRHYAEVECRDDPLYAAICTVIADTPELLALMAQAPATQARPNILLAALHERVLAGVAHPLTAYYASVGGGRMPDAELPALLLDFVHHQQEQLIEHLRSRSTQTNEIGRCAVLWPALSHIAARTGCGELALLDFGSSAGLNLGVDAYRYDYGQFALGAASGPVVNCAWRGPEPARTDWRLQLSQGIDPSPIDVFDEAAVRWLRACLWPSDATRCSRLDAALAIARTTGRRVAQHADCIAAIEPWLQSLPAGVQPVLLNSWVLIYLPAAELQRLREMLAAHPEVAWLNAELATLRPPGLALPPACKKEDPTTATLWTLQWQGRAEALAWSHGHGHWAEWLV